MIPFNFDLSIDQGSTKFIKFYILEDDNVTPKYLTGTNSVSSYICRMQIRRSYLSDSKILSISSEDETNQYYDDYIIFSEDEDGLVEIKISDYTTQHMPYGRHFYDIELKDIDNNIVMKLLKGRVDVFGEITRG